jgi:hypothetical protein
MGLQLHLHTTWVFFLIATCLQIAFWHLHCEIYQSESCYKCFGVLYFCSTTVIVLNLIDHKSGFRLVWTIKGNQGSFGKKCSLLRSSLYTRFVKYCSLLYGSFFLRFPLLFSSVLICQVLFLKVKLPESFSVTKS